MTAPGIGPGSSAMQPAHTPATRASAAPGDAQGTGPAPEAGASRTETAETLSADDTLTLAAIAAVKRAVDAEQAEIYISGGKGRIEFTDDSFATWYSAERAQIAQEVRAKIAEELAAKADVLLAEAKRLVNTGNGEVVIDLKDTAVTLQNAAALARGEQPAGVEALLTYAATLARGGRA